MQTTIIVATHKPYWVPDDPMYLPVQMGHAIHPAIGYIGDDTGENISERNANFCELTGLYWAAHNIDSDYIGIVHYRRYFASRRKSRFAAKKDRVISHEELCSILATTNVILPKERHYFIETNYTQYIHAHHKRDLTATRAIIARKCPEYLPAYDMYMSKTHGHHFNMFVMKKELLQHYCTWLFDILFELERELDIPVFHDDQHGTAIVVTAALINALRVVNKKMEDVHIVLNGPGAAGTAIIKMLMTAGAKDIVAVDQFGTLYKGCNSAEAHKNWLGEVTNPRQIKGGLKEALEGADVFIGVSKPGILTTELCKTMNKDAIVFAMANPTPEIMPDEAKAGGVRVMATGRSDFPNQVNNVLCFPGLFKGALSVRARDINNEMKLAAAYAIADLITDADRSEENIIPGAFDPRVAEAVANAVAKAARETGVARL